MITDTFRGFHIITLFGIIVIFEKFQFVIVLNYYVRRRFLLVMDVHTQKSTI